MTQDTIIEIVGSGIIVVAAIAVRLATGRWVRKRSWATPEEGRRWLVRIGNGAFLLAALLLAVVWADELRTAALSLVAFAVAFVIATQEFLKSILGSLLRASSNSFEVGDRVKIGEIRGIVIDHALLTTTLFEIGSGHVRTGRTVVVPNSQLLTQVVLNETRGHEYVLHSFEVPVPRSEWAAAEQTLLDAAQAVSEPYLDEAKELMEERAHRYSLPMPVVEPFVIAKATTTDTVTLTVRVPVAAADVWVVENRIERAWLEAGDEPPAPRPPSDPPTPGSGS